MKLAAEGQSSTAHDRIYGDFNTHVRALTTDREAVAVNKTRYADTCFLHSKYMLYCFHFPVIKQKICNQKTFDGFSDKNPTQGRWVTY